MNKNIEPKLILDNIGVPFENNIYAFEDGSMGYFISNIPPNITTHEQYIESFPKNKILR